MPSSSRRTLIIGLLCGVPGCIEQNPKWAADGDSTASSATSGSASSSATISDTTADPTTAATTTPASSNTSSSESSTGDGDTTEPPAEACDVAECPWWDEAWTHRSWLAIDGSDLAAPVDGLPIRVRLVPERATYDAALPDGADVRVVDDAGTPLPFEIEGWTPAGESNLWVRAPTVAPGETRIWIYYGNPAAGAAEDAGATWSGFGGVWHLDDLSDSTGNVADGASMGDVAVAGDIGGARGFDGSGAHIDFGENPALVYEGSLTISTWVRANTLDAVVGSNAIVAMGGVDESPSANVTYALSIHPAGLLRLAWETTPTADVDNVSDLGARWQDDRFHHVVAVRDPGAENLRFYYDGAPLGGAVSYSDEASSGAALTLLFGADVEDPSMHHLDGDLDEVRLTSAVRSADWIALEYRAGRDTLLEYSVPQALP